MVPEQQEVYTKAIQNMRAEVRPSTRILAQLPQLAPCTLHQQKATHTNISTIDSQSNKCVPSGAILGHHAAVPWLLASQLCMSFLGYKSGIPKAC